MKRILVSVGTVAILLGLSIVAISANKDSDGFTVTAVGGKRKDVKVKTEKGYAAAALGKIYPFGTLVKTGRNSTVDLMLSPGNTFRLMPRSKLAINRDVRNPKLKVLKLEKGTVSIKLDKFKGQKLQVETPTAICGALGTRFTMSFEDDGDAEKDDAKKGTREAKISCERGEIFASSRFKFGANVEEGKSFKAPSIKAGTEVVAKVHEGLENSYTDITVNRGSLTVDYGVKKGASFVAKAEKDKPSRFVCSFEKSNDDVDAAVVEVKSGSVEHRFKTSGFFGLGAKIKSEPVPADGPVLVTNNTVMAAGKAVEVAKYLKAAQEEAELHSQLVAKGVDPTKDKKLQIAAANATTLRKMLLTKRVRRMLQQIRRGARKIRR